MLPILWHFSHDLWTYRNEINAQVHAGVVALVTDCYCQPSSGPALQLLSRKSLPDRLLDGNCALFTWLSSVVNLSSISSGPCQTPITFHATLQRLSDATVGRLRRPLRRLQHLPSSLVLVPRSVLDGLLPSIPFHGILQVSSLLYRVLPLGSILPMPLPPARRKRMFKSSINSHAAWFIFLKILCRKYP